MRVKKEMCMQVQINSDNNISMHGRLSDSIGAYINNLLQRFDPYLTRVEVYLSGENVKRVGPKTIGPKDKRCVLEARAKRHQPLVVTNKSIDIEDAFSGAAAKMHRQLETTYGRLADKRRRKQKMEERIGSLPSVSAAD
jgi:ribosome-associated translation inhibitor RaiA